MEDSYSRVVAPEAICLGIFAAVHCDHKVIAADIVNTYPHGKATEKLYNDLGDELRELLDKV